MTARHPSKKGISPEAKLAASMDRLADTIERLPQDYGYVLQPSKHLFFSYLRGIAVGLGALTLVAIVIPFLLWFMREIQWVPLVGDFVTRVAERVENAQQ
jgi:hypothetical protein